jgi:hypothetical protein
MAIILSSCASGTKFKHLNHSKDITLKYIINYPSYSGMPKDEAKEERRKFMEQTMVNIYASVFRIGYYGRSDFNPNDFGGLSGHNLSHGNIPFIYKGGNPPTVVYDYFTRNRSRYGKISSTSYSSGNRRYSGGDYGWSFPIAKTESGEYIISPKSIQDIINKNILIVTRKEFDKTLSLFYSNHDIINSKTVFIEFLRKHGHKFINYTLPMRSLYKSLFTKSKMLKSGSGLSDEVTNVKNTLHFSLKQEINRQFIWGLMFLLNSEVSANRLNKKQLEVTLKVPVNKVQSKYSVQPLTKFIEQ